MKLFTEPKEILRRYLRSPSIGASLDGLTYVLPDAMPDDGLFVVDTSDLFAALEGAGTADRRALGRVCNLIQIPTNNLHNAGNDAYVSELQRHHSPCLTIPS
jgi:hypothetical protein